MEDNESNNLNIDSKVQTALIMAQIKTFFNNGIFTDVILVAGHEEFNCHKLILAASSNYFQTMFSSSFKENIDSRVYFESTSPWIMKCIIDFVYCGVCRISMTHVQELLQTAEMLEYPVLVQECCDYMAHHIDINNCFAIRSLSLGYKFKDLLEKSQIFIEKYFTSIATTSVEWLNLEVEIIIEYISNPLIDVRSEKTVWCAMMRWLKYDIDTRLNYLPKLINCIRLNQLQTVFLEDALSSTIIQKSKETCQIISEYLWSDNRENIMLKDIRPSTLKKPTMILLGGMERYVLNRVDSFDPIKNQWTSLAPIPENNLTWFGSSVLNNLIYITGGIYAGEITDHVYVYDSDCDSWSKCANMLSTRAKHGSACVLSRIYVVGGVTSSSEYSDSDLQIKGLPLNIKIDVYDPLVDQWSSVGLCESPRIESSIVVVKEQRKLENLDNGAKSVLWSLYEVGGTSATTIDSEPIVIHRVKEDFTIEPRGYYIKLPISINKAKCVVPEDSHIMYIFWENNGKLAQLDIKTNSLRFLSEHLELQHPHIHCGFCYLGNINSLIVVGGYQRTPESSLNPIAVSMHCYNMDTMTWRTMDRNKPYLDRAIVGTVVINM